ncbi:hypothetical protein RvY_14797-2 [Ramazzottius varieornatus]|uniref:Uncharacterized protein n=1 Tax=Ramazzottius varieornatus TaxID=947166 RepID=A0A1D1W0W5_RAMVA|nr:hypothetical protein RvY_14797-2 [Ramazzottius varieornatus]
MLRSPCRNTEGMGDRLCIVDIVFISMCLHAGLCSYRYYNSYLTYGTGDTIIQTYHYDSGTLEPMKKWNVECLDGEVAVIKLLPDSFGTLCINIS